MIVTVSVSQSVTVSVTFWFSLTIPASYISYNYKLFTY